MYATAALRAPEYMPVVTGNTFEHVYQNAGTYTVTIHVQAANGNTVKQTSTVVVSPVYSYCYNNGVTYKEGDTQSCLYTGGSAACIADAVYVCRSSQWKVEGGYWYR
jgi:PKD repeat protein